MRELLSNNTVGLSLGNLNIIRADSKLETKLLGLSTSGSHDNRVHMDGDSLHLSQFNGDGRRPVSDEVLQLASGNVSIHKLEHVILVGFLSQLNGDGAWSVGDKVFQLTTRNIGIHEFEDIILIRLLGQLDSDGGRSISDQILQLAS